MTSRISATFAALKQNHSLAFIPFVTAGDPDLAATCTLVRLLAMSGADLIEIGFPYSDPIADGPVIQSSYTRALAKKLKLKDIFAAIGTVSKEVSTPLVAMVSYAIIFRTGPTAFVSQAAAAGFAGLIVPDLPGDEAEEFSRICAASQLDLVPLVAPTTPAARVSKILKVASGFIYCIAVAGVTGARTEIAKSLFDELAVLRSKTQLPLAVGFGISGPDQVAELAGKADGAIVGSALVRHLEHAGEDSTAFEAATKAISEFATLMAKAAHTRKST